VKSKKDNSRSFFIQWIINAFVLLIVDKLFAGIYIDGFTSALMLSLLLSILNWTVKPVLSIFSFPLTLLTLGLFKLVINGIVLSIASFVMGSSFVISSFTTAMFAALVIAILTSLVDNDE